MTATTVPLRFQVGARTLLSVPRTLVRVPLGLDEVLSGRVPALPPLPASADGYAITSLPEERLAALVAGCDGLLAFVRQRYTRYHADLTLGRAGYMARLSGNTRSQLKRKTKKVAEASGGTLEIRRYRTPDEIEHFHAVARAVSARTYQERLLGSGLPDTPEFRAEMLALAAADRVRAWVLSIAGAPAAYLYCPARGDTLLYAYVGHDPAVADLSPGAVLHMEAMGDLLDEGRFGRFDFTEGEGQHKRQLATEGTACVDLMLLRPTLANRVAIAALGGFDRAMAAAKRMAGKPALKGLIRRLRRG